MIEIIPAIIPRDFDDLQEKLKRVRGISDVVQIDICDGKFVPSRSWPYGKHDVHFENMLSEEEGLPLWDDFDFEFDLMVANPEEETDNFVKIGGRRITVHVESVSDLGKFVDNFRQSYGDSKVSPVAPELGLAINPDTPNSVIEPFIERIDFVQFMAIKRIGYQGEPFDERVLEKIASLRAKAPDAIISVDGGVNFETAPRLIAAGANRLVSGSTIFNAVNPADAIRQLSRGLS